MSKISELFVASRILCSPLEAMYTLLIFIAVGELHVSPLQLALLAGSKPISSLLSFYASASVAGKPYFFKKYLIIMYTATALPALAFPLVDDGWYFVFSHIIFMAGQRAVYPIWNALMSCSMTFSSMSRLHAKTAAIQQSIMIFSPLLFGFLIDANPGIWRQIFLFLGLFQLLCSLMLLLLQIPKQIPKPLENTSFAGVISPWREGWKLLRLRPDFQSYLKLFFLGGAGLVMMQSALPVFFKADLHLSYSSISLAVSCCKGLALIASSQAWAYWVNRISLFRLNFYINLLSTLFVAAILTSNFNVNWIFLAYLLYGAMQAGCELSWNMCGPFFAKDKESTLYSSLNLPLVGIRGLIFPFAAQGILLFAGANMVFICAGIICLASVVYANSLDQHLTHTMRIRIE